MNGTVNSRKLITYCLWMIWSCSIIDLIDSLVQTVYVFSEDIGMEFGLRKCGIILPDGQAIKQIDEDRYRYLEINHEHHHYHHHQSSSIIIITIHHHHHHHDPWSIIIIMIHNDPSSSSHLSLSQPFPSSKSSLRISHELYNHFKLYNSPLERDPGQSTEKLPCYYRYSSVLMIL